MKWNKRGLIGNALDLLFSVTAMVIIILIVNYSLISSVDANKKGYLDNINKFNIKQEHLLYLNLPFFDANNNLDLINQYCLNEDSSDKTVLLNLEMAAKEFLVPFNSLGTVTCLNKQHLNLGSSSCKYTPKGTINLSFLSTKNPILWYCYAEKPKETFEVEKILETKTIYNQKWEKKKLGAIIYYKNTEGKILTEKEFKNQNG